ncbi:hypothetical protein HDV01_007862 [Terramyces sp. JEL0728]|nr:hypothetical protein HDV01_007862 [Terramyces sp. JEL0728]
MALVNSSAAFLLDICDYRANYLGCNQTRIQAFAKIDIIMIILAVVSILVYSGKIAQNFFVKVIKEKDNRKKWNAIDTTCLLCCLSNVFRIVQLVNVRSVAYRDITKMSEFQIRQYLQINIFMDFIYYGVGIAASSVFVASVVSATAGVSMYSDIKIGSTVISPDRILRVFRIVVLVLTLSFNICWATIGTTAGVEYYTLYRRSGFILCISTIAIVTLPVILFFSNKVLHVIMEGSSNSNSRNKEEGHSQIATKTADSINSEHRPKSDIGNTPSVTSNVSKSSAMKKKYTVKSTVDKRQAKITNFRLAINMSAGINIDRVENKKHLLTGALVIIDYSAEGPNRPLIKRLRKQLAAVLRVATKMASEEPKKIVIIGAGITGLSLALALERLKKDLNIKVVVYEKEVAYSELQTPHHVLWKSGIEGLLELGLAKRLGKICWPIAKLTTINAESGESILHWNWPPEDINDEEIEQSYLPPMVGVRKTDIIRMLMTALAGREDLVGGLQLAVTFANNLSPDGVKGIEGDLAREDWFNNDGFEELLPNVRFGHELLSLSMSGNYGKVTMQFKNGHEEECFMVIGCDGINSKVRSLLLNNKINRQEVNQLVIHGITPLDSPKSDFGESENVEKLDREQLLAFCPDGTCSTWVDQSFSFGVTNIGNDMLGWNLVVPQKYPGQHANDFTMPQRRKEIGSLASMSHLAPPQQELARSGSGGSAEDWILPSDSQRGSLNSVDKPVTFKANMEFIPPPTILPEIAFMSVGSEILTGPQSIGLALKLAKECVGIPHPALSLIAASDVHLAGSIDNTDLLTDTPLKSLTSPQFHPGRVILLGDAAHSQATSAHGSHGASFGIMDAITLAKLIGHYFTAQGKSQILAQSPEVRPNSSSLDSIVLEHIATEITKLRLGVGNEGMQEARAQATWVKREPGFWKSLLRLNVSGNGWSKLTFSETVKFGKSELDNGTIWPTLHP